MIKFETMVGEFPTGKERVQSSNNAFFNIKEILHAEKVQRIVSHGIYYGYIKLLLNEEELLECYHLQIVPVHWLHCIEVLEKFMATGYAHVKFPSFIELKRIDVSTLSFKLRERIFILPYEGFVEQFIRAASEYFALHQQITNDDLYEDIILYLKQLQM